MNFNQILKHVYCEPKFVARMQYWRECPSPAQQILGGIPRPVMEDFIEGKDWPEDIANQEIRVIRYEEIDFDWWEPRHDAPWRRQDARNRGESA